MDDAEGEMRVGLAAGAAAAAAAASVAKYVLSPPAAMAVTAVTASGDPLCRRCRASWRGASRTA